MHVLRQAWSFLVTGNEWNCHKQFVRCRVHKLLVCDHAQTARKQSDSGCYGNRRPRHENSYSNLQNNGIFQKQWKPLPLNTSTCCMHCSSRRMFGSNFHTLSATRSSPHTDNLSQQNITHQQWLTVTMHLHLQPVQPICINSHPYYSVMWLNTEHAEPVQTTPKPPCWGGRSRDVMKLVKICIRRILTFNIHRMQMRMWIVAFIFQVGSRNVVHWFRLIKWLLHYVISQSQ